MGGVAGYARPVDPTAISTWRDHKKRGTPSVEPGCDYYAPIGTPVRVAASGVVVEVGTSIQPATGYYVKVNLDDGRSVRYLHLSQILVTVGSRLEWGQYFAYSGATGYGEQDWSWNVAETGGAHVHMTVFPTHFYPEGWRPRGIDDNGDDYTIDPETLMAPDQGAGYNNLEDDMPTMNEFLNTPAYDGGPTISTFFKNVDQGGVATQVWARTVDRGADGQISALQELADAKTVAMRNAGRPISNATVDIDEAALAASLAPLITANLGALSDADVARIASASADEQAKRLAS